MNINIKVWRLHSERVAQRPWHLSEHGLSLVEVMAAMVISLIVVGSAFTALISSTKSTHVNDQVAQTQQNARLAMELLARDIRMAGFGMTGPVGACTAGIMPDDNVETGPDTGPDAVSVVVPNTNTTIAPLWTLRAQAQGPFTTIDLQVGAVAGMVTAGLGVGSTVSIGGAVSSTVTLVDSGNDRLTLQNQIGPPRIFPVGTQVFLLDCITYNISTNAVTCAGIAPCLLRGGVPMVEGIEDLQLAYACDGCNAAVNGGVADGIPDDQNGSGTFDAADFVTNTAAAPNEWAQPPMTPDTIRLVQINIVAKQPREDRGMSESNVRAISTAGPIILSDHDPSADAGFNLFTYQVDRRRVLIRTVETRNMGP